LNNDSLFFSWGYSSQHQTISGDTCRYLPIPADTCRYLPIPADTCRYLPIPADTCQYLAIPGNNFTILNNTEQYLFQTIPNNLVSAGIIWYRQYIKYSWQCNTSITMVLSRYDTDSVVSIWYCHGTDSGNFQKNFNAYLGYAEIAR
jgi:hypothetical protein